MNRPTEDEMEYGAENADVGRCGCLLPTGDAFPDNEDDYGEDDED